MADWATTYLPHQPSEVRMTPVRAESDIFCADDQAVQPWQAEPYRLWSLFEMLIFSANSFFWSGRALRSIQGDCLAASAIVVDGQAAFAMGQDLDNRAREKALSWLATVEMSFRRIAMTITADTTRELIEELQEPSRHSFDWLHSQAEAIERLAEKELRGKFFLYIPPERVKSWPTNREPDIFGEAVAKAFHDSARDIAAAGRCLALGEGTACVSHLVRALEWPLQSFAKRVGVVFPTPTDLENWKTIVDQMAKKIEAEVKRLEGTSKSHERNAELQFLGDVALDFRHFKNAWRNGVAHGRDWYDEQEAQRVFDAVKHFMQKMAEVA